MALHIKGSHGLALLITAGITGWMATGETVFSGEPNEKGVAPPAVRNEAIKVQNVRVAVVNLTAQDRISNLVIRGRTEADTKVSVRSETTAIVRKRYVEKGQWVEKDTLLCELDAGSREARLAQAKASLAQAEFDLNAKMTLSKKGFASKTQLQSLTAQRDAALASVKEAQLELERIRITAPIDGVVQAPLAEIGDQLTMGGTCATLMNADPMLVVGQVSERDVSKIKLGAKASVTLVTGEETEGRIRYIASASDTETRTFRVEVEVENAARQIRDGVTALANLELEPLKAHLMSPAQLTLSDDGIIGVMLVKEGKAQFTPVNILANDKDGVWLGGLPETITVISIGQEYVKSGQPVEAVSPEQAKQIAKANAAGKAAEEAQQ